MNTKANLIYQWMKECTGTERFRNVIYDGTWLFACDSYRLYQVKRSQMSLQAWKKAHIQEWNLPESGGNWNQTREGKSGLLACGDFEVFNGLRSFQMTSAYKIVDLPVLHKHVIPKHEVVPMPDDESSKYWGNPYNNHYLQVALECPLFVYSSVEIALLESGVLRIASNSQKAQAYVYIMRMSH